MAEGVKNRSCGECSECCVVMHVQGVANKEVMDKPSHTPCKHQLRGGGCGVYRERPGSCASWSCMWRKGEIGTDAERPDKTGIIVHELPIRSDKGVDHLVVMSQSRKGAQASAHARELRRDLVRSGRTVLADTNIEPEKTRRRLIVDDGRTLSGTVTMQAVQAKIPIHFVRTREPKFE
jgi:hypothetical protein